MITNLLMNCTNLICPAGRTRAARPVFPRFIFAVAFCLLLMGTVAASAQLSTSALVKSEFIFEKAPFKSCHASTIVETRDGLLASWFGGSEEGALDVDIWQAGFDGQRWSDPKNVANGMNQKEHVRYPCWNPVLFRPRYQPLYLFYKVGPNPASWWGMVMSSDDNGKTWSKPKRLPEHILGPIRNKPVELDSGLILCGSSTESAGWRVHMEQTRNPKGEWTRSTPLNSALEYGAIQPTILSWPNGKIQILCRTKQRKITECWSEDNGLTWTRMMPTSLPNPNSAIDSVLLRDGRALLVYNHSTEGRDLLNVALSKDGKLWKAAMVLENSPGDEFSYPAVIQASTGLVHITYTWKRERIKHVVIDPSKLEEQDIQDGRWPW